MNEIRCAIELREDDSRQSPGRIVGELITYEKRAADRPEYFVDGALQWDDRGIILNEQHDRRQPIMRFTPEQRGKSVYIDAPLPDTQRGRDAAVMVRDGTMTGLSIEFRGAESKHVDGVRRISRAVLAGAALVDDASYKGSLEIRQKGAGRQPTAATLWL